MNRTVAHINVVDFAVAVERLVDRRLNNRPVIVAPTGASRALVYDMSQEAFIGGVRKGMSLTRAMRLCPDAAVCQPRYYLYEKAMKDFFCQACRLSPLVEAGEDDGHLFIDLTRSERLFGPAVDIAWKLGRNIKTTLGFSPVWAVGPNKLVAKTATRLVKPTGEYVVGQGEEESFLAPVALDLLPGVESADAVEFNNLNLELASHVAAWDLHQLRAVFGQRASFFYNLVRGIDPSPVLSAGAKPVHAKAEHVFGDDTNDPQLVLAALWLLVERAALDLRSRRLCARLIRVMVEYSDGKRRFGNCPTKPTANDFALFQSASKALFVSWTRRTRIRRLCLVCDKPVFPPAQMEFFEGSRKVKSESLLQAVDKIRSRFGGSSVRFGRTLPLYERCE